VRARAQAFTARSADVATWPVGTGRWLLWDEVTRTSTGEVLVTRRARIGEWGLTEALWRRRGGERLRGDGIPTQRWRNGGR
jgi:hypothetical protein